ncbi:hypothetical protein ACTJKN_07500 [Pedobacter sp. 22163]|uniref:hypothetical protein n=1 Tax=Pedobacter sp. 22163 TaxID=3453883 RepID=UPI003F838CC8
MTESEISSVPWLNINTTKEKIEELRNDWKEYLKKKSEFFGQKIGTGKGIVISAGGLRYFTSSWVLISKLRESGCNLDIELWYYGDEVSASMKRNLSKFKVKCKNIENYVDEAPHGFLMKPLSILYSSFKEVLFLDADNMCVRDPSYLFYDKNYLKTGNLFWPDYWKTSEDNPIWEILELAYFDSYEQDSGQLLINKEKSWDQLQLCLYFNIRHHDYYNFIYGDKDTFRFAWLAMGKPVSMIEKEVGSCGYTDQDTGAFNGITMVQHDPSGEIIFLHRNLLKWDITEREEHVWETVKTFIPSASNKNCQFKRGQRGHNAIDLTGNVTELSFEKLFPGFEKSCLEILHNLRSKKFYHNELLRDYLNKNRFKK